MAEVLKNDYQNWTRTGDAWFVFPDSRAQMQARWPKTAARSGTIYTEFTLDTVPGSAILSVQSERTADGSGTAESTVRLTKPDGSAVTLYDDSGTLAKQFVLDGVDVRTHLDAIGTYRLTLTVNVAPEEVAPYVARVRYYALSLVTAAANAWEIILDESAGAVEKFVSGATFLEPAKVVEHFDIVKTTPAVAEQERLIAGIDDNTVLIFDTGTSAGRFDTDDEDYGYPGMDKQLDEVQFESNAEAPHTVTVYASIDSGLSWTLLGTVVVQRGRTCSVFACITAVKHMVSFRGPGLHLSSYVMYAIPRGRMPKQ